MAGQAFDGSIWVAGGPIVGLVFGSLAMTGAGALILTRAQAQRAAMAAPPQQAAVGRRKVALRADDRAEASGKRGDFDVSADRAEAERLPDKDAVLRDLADKQ